MPEKGQQTESLKRIRAALPGFEIYEWRHASAVLITDFPNEWRDIKDVLSRFELLKSQVCVGGGSKSQMAGWIDSQLEENKGWEEREFKTAIRIDKEEIQSPTHKVDCFKNRVGLEIEWNNKDPFFDRDLNNFRLLFDLRALAVGVIVTRSDDLQPLFKELARKKLKSKTASWRIDHAHGEIAPKTGRRCWGGLSRTSHRNYGEALHRRYFGRRSSGSSGPFERGQRKEEGQESSESAGT